MTRSNLSRWSTLKQFHEEFLVMILIYICFNSVNRFTRFDEWEIKSPNQEGLEERRG